MNRHDPQLGVFIRKHATAAAQHCNVSLLCVLGDESQDRKFEIEENDQYGIKSTMVYFRKFSSAISFLNQSVNFFRYLSAARIGLRRVKAKSGKHDITHAYILLRPALIAWWLRITQGIPFVVSEQWSGYATGKFSEKNFLEKYLCRLVVRKANAVTAVSKFLARKMEENGLPADYAITPNIVEPVKETTALFPHDGKIRILTVADLVDEIKNISATIKVVAKLAEENKNIEFHIVGHGKDEQKLKGLAETSGLLNRIVFFHGVKTNEEVFQYLYSSDFLVMNSRFETFSLICIEAMSCGKPVIATRCGGPNEYMNDSNGILIDPDRPDQLMEAMNQMISRQVQFDPSVLKSFSTSHFGMKHLADDFLRIYSEILKR